MAKLSRDKIVTAARANLAENGHEALALRGLARDLGVTAPALYDHFDSKDSLLRSLAEDGFLALIEATAVESGRPIERIRQRALLYVAFASANPELFRLMFLFRPSAVPLVADTGENVDNELGAASKAFDQGSADLTLAIANGDVVDRDVTEVGLILWAAVHGVATIALTAPSVAETVAEDVVDTLLAGLRPS